VVFEARGGVDAAEHPIQEAIDKLFASARGQPRQPVHQRHLLRAWATSGHRGQHRTAQPQDADLHIQRLDVRGGHLGDAGLLVQHAPDVRQSQSQFPQGGHQLQAGDTLRVVEPVTAAGAPHRHQHTRIRPEPDRACRLSTTTRQLSYGQQHPVVLVPCFESGPDSGWKVKPTPRSAVGEASFAAGSPQSACRAAAISSIAQARHISRPYPDSRRERNDV
jgi:hypothetical protein